MSEGEFSLPPLERARARTAVSTIRYLLVLIFETITVSLHIPDAIQDDLFAVFTILVIFLPQAVDFSIGRCNLGGCSSCRRKLKYRSEERRVGKECRSRWWQ